MPVAGKAPIIAFAHHPWDEPQWMNRQQLLSRLAARGWPVIYSCGALDLWQRRSAEWQEAPVFGSFARMDGVTVDRPGKWPPRWRRWPAWDRLALKAHAARLRAAARATSPAEPIALAFHPMFWPSVEALRARRVALHVYDAYPLMGQWSDELDGYLRALAGAADLITVAAEAMAGILPESARGKVRFLPNGADVRRFIEADDAPCPADLAAIPRPRIGYAGGLNRKVDYPAIAEIARRRPDWHLVLIGSAEDANVMADPDLADAFAACRSLANVHFLGLRPRAEIAALARHMDVNVMIYRSDGSGWYRYIYPLKLHEYLAAGRPVVSSPLDSVTPFRAVVDLADTPDAWLAAIERALAGGVGTPDQRRAVALENTWDKRVDLLEGWLTGLTAR